MLVNRQKDLKYLEEGYNKPNSQLKFVFGRKYIGKTALISHFIKDKKAIYISLNDMRPNLFFTNMANEISSYFSLYKMDQKFNSFLEVLNLLNRQNIEEKLIIVVEDFHNILKIDKKALEELLSFWRKQLSKKNIYFILTSAIIFKDDYMQELEKNNDFLLLKSLEFETIKTMLPNLPKLDQLCVYTLLGTSPRYLKYYNKNINLAENIYNLFLSTNSYLFNLGLDILKSEIQDIGTYCSILYAISLGKTKIGDIAEFLNVKSTYLSRYIQKLLEMMILIKEIPIDSEEKSGKFGRYIIEDNALKFWFYYIYPNKNLISKQELLPITKQIQENFMSKTIQDSYKKYIKEHILKNKRTTFGYEPTTIGSWWDNNSNSIDLVAYDRKNITFVQILWQDEEMAKIAYGKLKVISEKMQTTLQKKYMIVSKNSYFNTNKSFDNE